MLSLIKFVAKITTNISLSVFLKRNSFSLPLILLGLCFLSQHVFAQTEPNVKPPAARGIYAIWYGKNKDVLNLPYIKGGQIAVQWADVELAKGQYDFSEIDKQLRQFKTENKMTTIQVNGGKKPLWMYDVIPHHPEKLSHQIDDNQGSLMYWHPTFIEAYINFIKAYATHLKQSKYLPVLAGVRMNFNALGTEHFLVPEEERLLSKWVTPNGVEPGTPWTPLTATNYEDRIASVFIDEFNGINLFLRNNITPETEIKYKQALLNGKLMLFHTSSEIEPRSAPMEQKYHLFKVYAGSGKTIAYAEPWADAWGYHGPKKDPRWTSPGQYIYWRLLFDLHTGVSMPAIYSADLDVAAKGKHPREGDVRKYQQSFNNAIKFAAMYAGYHASPIVSPGAWIAFRHNEKNISYEVIKEFTGNYSFLMTQLLPDDTKWQNVIRVGPEVQRFGAWAKVVPQGQNIRLQLSNIYATSLEGKPAVVRVIYFDNGKGAFETAFSTQHIKTDLQGTQTWKTLEIPVEKALFEKDENGAHITITSLSGDVTVHMVAVERGDGVPNEVSEISVNGSGKNFKISWKNPLDYDLDHIEIYNGEMLIKTVSSAQNEAEVKVIDRSRADVRIKTFDEAGRKSNGVGLKL